MSASTLAGTPATKKAPARASNTELGKLNQEHGNNGTEHANGKPQTTLGCSLFFEPLAGQCSLGDLRSRVELKYAACIASGGTNGFPLHVNRITNLKLRALAAAGMVLKRWNVKDLIGCSGGLAGVAESVLITTLERPRWGPEDFTLLDLLERMEAAQSRALGGGLTL